MTKDPKIVNRFTKRAKTPTRRRQWKHVYESAIAQGDDEGKAIRKASGVVKDTMARGRAKRARSKR
jgi:hypothetical protein